MGREKPVSVGVLVYLALRPHTVSKPLPAGSKYHPVPSASRQCSDFSALTSDISRFIELHFSLTGSALCSLGGNEDLTKAGVKDRFAFSNGSKSSG